MAQEHDDVARALERLASGEVSDHHEDAEHHNDHHVDYHAPPAAPAAPARPAPPARPAAPQANRPASPRPSSPAGARPNESSSAAIPSRPPRPSSPRPADPVAPAASKGSRPGTPVRPSAPMSARPAVQRPVTPEAQMPPTENYVSPDPQSDPAEQQAIDDDDQVIVPAPDASVFLHAPRTVPAKAPRGQSIQFRQTVIPIVLTGGLIMIGLGLLHFVWTSDNSPLAGLPGWLVGILFVFGLILWTVAALNMLAVKQALDAKMKTTRA